MKPFRSWQGVGFYSMSIKETLKHLFREGIKESNIEYLVIYVKGLSR